jgi:hypothetical protein
MARSKSKAGKPPANKGVKTSVRFDPDTHTRLHTLAAHRRMTLSNLVARIVAAAVRGVEVSIDGRKLDGKSEAADRPALTIEAGSSGEAAA